MEVEGMTVDLSLKLRPFRVSKVGVVILKSLNAEGLSWSMLLHPIAVLRAIWLLLGVLGMRLIIGRIR